MVSTDGLNGFSKGRGEDIEIRDCGKAPLQRHSFVHTVTMAGTP